MAIFETNEVALDDMDFKIANNGVIEIDRKEGIVEAFAAVIGNKDNVNDVIVPGAFSASLAKRHPRAVWHHSWKDPIGKVLEIEEVSPTDFRVTPEMRAAGAGGLWVKVQFNLNTQRGRDAFEDVAFFGKDFGWSIGYKTRQSDFDPKQNANLLKEIDLYEVSPVLHGANPLAGTLSIKSEDIGCYDFKSCSGATMTEEPEEKVGRVVATRNMKKLAQAIEILQSIMGEGGLDTEVKEKTDFVANYEQTVEEIEDGKAIVYGNSPNVRGVTLDVVAHSRENVAEVLTKTNDLICGAGFMVQVPHSEKGGTVRFYFPGESDMKDEFSHLSLSLEGVSFDLEPSLTQIRGYESSDLIPVETLFTEPQSQTTDNS